MHTDPANAQSLMPVCVGMLGWDITTIGNEKTVSHGGAGFHFVTAAAVFGVRFKLLSYTNREEWRAALSALEGSGVDLEWVSHSEESVAFQLIYDQHLRLDVEQFKAIVPDPAPDMLDVLRKGVKPGQFVHICSTTMQQDKGYIETAFRLGARLSTQIHIATLLQDVDFYRKTLKLADYVFMNAEEAQILSGGKTDEEVFQYMRENSQGCVYITSSRGAVAVTRDGLFACPSIPLPAIQDPTGAGDAFAGGCTAGRMLTGRLDVGLRMGTLCAAAKLSGRSSTTLISLLKMPPRTQ